ncbi:MAG: gamma-glutamyl-gamma-aminobutyrate hydrolase family protein, partial [Planctomycetota bacterium]|nr:gamma-glutamyl-gamma-aminobutyrate hydrolase family protein [Planctomycetota bacterium]
GGIRNRVTVELDWVEAEEIERSGEGRLEAADGILVPGGFGQRGFEGKVRAASFARRRGVPYFGICYGLHAAAVEFAREVLGLAGANSTENDRRCPHPVIALITEWRDDRGSLERRDESSELGGTMRLGAQECVLRPGTLAHRLYGRERVRERHRHRYEFNNRYRAAFEERGMVVSGVSADGSLVEMIELRGHPWFLACQFHPE